MLKRGRTFLSLAREKKKGTIFFDFASSFFYQWMNKSELEEKGNEKERERGKELHSNCLKNSLKLLQFPQDPNLIEI